jgi:probable F420-dependent oxidoreductase
MAVRIGMGLGRFTFESASDFRGWLDLCEDSAIDSIWQSDQVMSRQSALEPMTLLSIVAGATRRLKFGTNAIVLPFRDPITFARQCATLDHMSEGRFLPAVAIGRAEAPEWEATGRSPKGRGTRADEALEVITRLWKSEGAHFEGEFFSLKDATINPRPKQDPLPLWLGGASKAAVRRTARFGSGWLAPLQTPDETAETVKAIRHESRRIGRPIPDDHYGATLLYRIGAPADPKPPSRKEQHKERHNDQPNKEQTISQSDRIERIQAIGDADRVLSLIRQFREVGVTKFIAIPLVRNRAELMEQTRLLDEEVLPHAND